MLPPEALTRKTPPERPESLITTSFDSTAGPSAAEVAWLIILTFAVFVAVVAMGRNYIAAVNDFGDSSEYMDLASAIRRWEFSGIIIKQFWGLPYAMAGLSKTTGLSDLTTLLIFSFGPSLLAGLLAWRLWDGWIAGYFAILNFDWIQRSCLGGSEPLFVCLLLAAFISVRQQRWLLASLLGSLATVVRPLGLFALVGIGLALLLQRDFRKLVAATALGLVIGVLYAIPLATYFGDPLATVSSYHNPKWQGGWLFGFPFYAIIKGTLIFPTPWTNLVLSFGWIFLVLVAIVEMVKCGEFRAYCRAHIGEAAFLIPYLGCLFTYNYPYWARGTFARFAIPILPFVLLALYRWIPKDRRVLWGLGVASPILAACSALGIENVWHMLHRAVQ